MRILALDVGDKRVGVAVNDPMGWHKAQPLKLVLRSDILKELPKMIEEYNIKKIIVGIPKNEDESLSEQGKKIMHFVRKLEKTVSVPLITWDETLTSLEAEKILIEADVSRKKRKKSIDKLAATLILQSYLNHEESHS